MVIFRLFKNDGRRYHGFLNFYIINGRMAQEGRTASPYQIWSKSVKTGPRYGDYSISQDGGRHHLGFSNFKLLTVGLLKRAELRRRAKFR